MNIGLRRHWLIWLATLLVLALVAFRIALPGLVKDYVNGRLETLDSYTGSIEDIDIKLWRGAYRVNGLRIVKTGAAQPVPFFSSDYIDFSVEWRSLLRGSLVAEGEFVKPDLNLVKGETEQSSQLGKEENWANRLEDLFPFNFNTVRIKEGRVTFTAPGISTKDALTAQDINGQLINLTNVVETGKETFAEFGFTASVLGNAPLGINGSVNPLAAQPTFDINAKLENVQLPQVNPWLREYIKADAESGQFALYIEFAAADGKFTGYAKPLVQDVDMYRAGEAEPNPLRRVWEGVVDFAANVLKNDESDQVAARIPFSGTLKNPQAGIFETIVSVMQNAFISAFSRSLEGSISLRDVKKNLTGLREGDDPDGRPPAKK